MNLVIEPQERPSGDERDTIFGKFIVCSNNMIEDIHSRILVPPRGYVSHTPNKVPRIPKKALKTILFLFSKAISFICQDSFKVSTGNTRHLQYLLHCK
jgi:hypothetical protein